MAAWSASWVHKLVDDLRPTPGRMAKSLRVVAVSVITLVVIMTFRLPFPSLGLYFVFLVNRTTPVLTLRSSLYILTSIGAAIAAELFFVAVSENDPVIRLMSLSAIAFVGGIFI